MRSLQYKGERTGKNINLEEFGSMSELLKCNNERNEWFGEPRPSVARELGFPSWSSLEDAVFSYSKDVKKLRGKIKAASEEVLIKRKEKLAVEGGNPCVPAYLMGHPNTMINQAVKKSPGKFLEVFIDTAYSWNIPKKDVEEYFEGVIEYVSALSARGFRISITSFASLSSYDEKDSSTVLVRIKSPGEKFNLKKIMFAVAHEAMLRGIVFDWYQRSPHAREIPSYGIPLYHWKTRDRELLLEDLGVRDRLIWYKSDYKKIIGGE